MDRLSLIITGSRPGHGGCHHLVAWTVRNLAGTFYVKKPKRSWANAESASDLHSSVSLQQQRRIGKPAATTSSTMPMFNSTQPGPQRTGTPGPRVRIVLFPETCFCQQLHKCAIYRFDDLVNFHQLQKKNYFTPFLVCESDPLTKY